MISRSRFFFTLVLFLFSHSVFAGANGLVAIKNLDENHFQIRMDSRAATFVKDFLSQKKISTKFIKCRSWKDDSLGLLSGPINTDSCVLQYGVNGFEKVQLKKSDPVDSKAGFEIGGSANVEINEGEINLGFRSGVAKKLATMANKGEKPKEKEFKNEELLCSWQLRQGGFKPKMLFMHWKCNSLFQTDGKFKAAAQTKMRPGEGPELN